MKDNCAFCKEEFSRPPSKMNRSKSGLNFCSRECKDKAQRIGGIKAIHPAHYGTTKADYRSIVERDGGIEKCERCDYDEFPEILEIHHKDRDRTNNERENLEVLCPNCHAIDHLKHKDGRFKSPK